ncbi:hypothetical protein EDI_153100 [Entamoeba dispar SAW760]|uniref:VPS9 domain-containing protein n=1 Tax=Entamoeba dispar (strain ATCC PRA-260 / SAW760) TaxID=370354 RepID=B0EBH2_ENTDS|nr:uncharacterized protein EDI_153100 [Entamoeba dispar SAW760]EDR28129.1 hypothetical protein EDI_153100 [Entamoeba dispar SAW760]|eukprot:EDR28129.1 hypothetical protein EDI_153100 [Entamoeba dispar SAW760]
MSCDRVKQIISLFQQQSPIQAAETVFRSILTNETDPACLPIMTTMTALYSAIQSIDINKYESKELTRYVYKLVSVNCQTIKAAIIYKEPQLLKYEEPILIGVLDNVSKMVGPKHYALFLQKNKEKDNEFIIHQKKFAQLNLRELLQISPNHFPYTNTYDQAMTLLNMVEKSTNASSMLNRLVDIQQEINHSLEIVYGEVPTSFDADALLSILQFLLIRSKIQHPFSIINFIESHFSSKDYSTQYGFSLTTFTIAAESILQITGNADPRSTVLNDSPLLNTKITSFTPSPKLSLPLHFMVASGMVDSQMVMKYF